MSRSFVQIKQEAPYNYRKEIYMNNKYLRKENEDDLDYAMRLIDIKKE